MVTWPQYSPLIGQVTSDDFFWNRMAFIYCLNVAADFSDRIGESMGATYRSTAEDIKAGRGTSEGGKVAHCCARCRPW